MSGVIKRFDNIARNDFGYHRIPKGARSISHSEHLLLSVQQDERAHVRMRVVPGMDLDGVSDLDGVDLYQRPREARIDISREYRGQLPEKACYGNCPGPPPLKRSFESPDTQRPRGIAKSLAPHVLAGVCQLPPGLCSGPLHTPVLPDFMTTYFLSRLAQSV